jgi:hypothetical protein
MGLPLRLTYAWWPVPVRRVAQCATPRMFGEKGSHQNCNFIGGSFGLHTLTD